MLSIFSRIFKLQTAICCHKLLFTFNVSEIKTLRSNWKKHYVRSVRSLKNRVEYKPSNEALWVARVKWEMRKSVFAVKHWKKYLLFSVFFFSLRHSETSLISLSSNVNFSRVLIILNEVFFLSLRLEATLANSLTFFASSSCLSLCSYNQLITALCLKPDSRSMWQQKVYYFRVKSGNLLSETAES